MKTISPALQDLLNSETQFLMADLFTFTLLSGVILRYTTADVDIAFGGYTWISTGPMISRGTTRAVVGIEVDTLDLTINADSTTTINTVPLIEAIWRGALDGAALTLKRVFMSDWSTPVGTILLFTGNVADVDAYRTAAKVKVKSLVERLDIKMPRNVYQAGCVHTLYDSGCTVNAALFTVSGASTGQNSDGTINTNLSQADDYFNMGSIRFITGANAGVVRTIKKYWQTNGACSFFLPLPVESSSGDTFTITPGCDKKRTGDCTNKYNNVIRFKGFEFIPVPETAA